MKGALSLVAVLLLAGTVQAKDFCIDSLGSPSDSPDFIGENFKLPKKGKCKPFIGVGLKVLFERNAISGSACASSDGTHVIFVFVLGTSVDVRLHAVTLALPSLQGTAAETIGSVDLTSPAVGFECDNDLIP